MSTTRTGSDRCKILALRHHCVLSSGTTSLLSFPLTKSRLLRVSCTMQVCACGKWWRSRTRCWMPTPRRRRPCWTRRTRWQSRGSTGASAWCGMAELRGFDRGLHWAGPCPAARGSFLPTWSGCAPRPSTPTTWVSSATSLPGGRDPLRRRRAARLQAGLDCECWALFVQSTVSICCTKRDISSRR
jgi:hypothetical protein